MCVYFVGEFYKPNSAILLFYGQLEASIQGHARKKKSLIYRGVGKGSQAGGCGSDTLEGYTAEVPL